MKINTRGECGFGEHADIKQLVVQTDTIKFEMNEGRFDRLEVGSPITLLGKV